MSNKPSFLKKNATIGLCAPSFGCATSPYIERYNNALKTFKKLGYKIVEGENVNSYDFIASATPQKRAQEFMDLMLNDEIDFIFSVGGGELMCQILPYIDFDKIKALKKKKLFMGYSDNTILTFTLPIFADSYAIYGECFPTFGVRKWDKSLKDAYALITGQEMIQHPYPKCADPQKHTDNPLKRDPYIKKTAWKRYQSDDPVTFKGILMGGCMDILNVICGTPYFEIDDYLEKHKKEGFIIFLEACEFHALAQKRAYWQFKNASLFKYCNGIIIGRPLMTYPMFDHTYVEMIDELKDLNIPIIYDVDIGHVPPSITLISGAMAEVHFEKNQKKCYLKHLIK